jgi:DNA polymerase IV
MPSPSRVILHLDLDAFFAQAEVLAAPALKGKPLIVGGIPGGRGVVATASYEARVYGISSGMSLLEAARRCPDAVFLPCHPPRYFDLSSRLLRLLLTRTPAVEVASIDEAYLDASRLVADLTGGFALAKSIQDDVRRRLALSCSIGVGENKLVAKMAAGLRKPGGLTCLDRAEFGKRFHPEPVSTLYGVGIATTPKLERIGIRTVADLAAAPDRVLRSLFGVWGPLLGSAARGEDESPVIPYHSRPDAKSIGHEYTLPRDESDRDEVRRVFLGLCDEVASDLRAEGWMAGSVHIRIRWRDWKTIGRQCGLVRPADSARRIFHAGWRLFEMNDSGMPVRLIGISAAHLVPKARVIKPGDLFDEGGEEELTRAIDQVRESFGRGILKRASLLKPGSRGVPSPAIARSAVRGRSAAESQAKDGQGR